MAWFDDEASIRAWGGPSFRFPCSEASFLEDMGWDTLDAFSLLTEDDELAGFGQLYLRDEKGHLARLAVAPSRRGNGLGRFLVRQLMRRAARQFDCDQCSLFVLEDNVPALNCYQSLGFRYAVDSLAEHPSNIRFMIADTPATGPNDRGERVC